MSADSGFDDKQIADHIRSTTSKRKNADYDRQQLMQKLRSLALRGDEANYDQQLLEAGIVPGSPKWLEFKSVFRDFRQSR